MKNIKRIMTSTILLLSVFLLAGCFGSDLPKNTGSMTLALQLPEELTAQFVDFQITVHDIIVTMTKGDLVHEKTMQVSDLNTQVEFANLEEGTWNLHVRVRDYLSYNLYTGTSKATITADSTTSATVDLVLVDGNVSFYPTFSPELSITVRLENQYDWADLELSATEHTSISDLMATTWYTTYEATDLTTGEVIATATEYIDILPGRTVERKVTLNSENEIVIDDETVTSPERLTAYNLGEDLVLIWEQGGYHSNIAGYLIYRSESETGPKTLLNPNLHITTTFTDDTIDLSQDYWYWVQALDNLGNTSELSEPFCYGGIEPNYYHIFYSKRTYGTTRYQISYLEEMQSFSWVYLDHSSLPPVLSPDARNLIYFNAVTLSSDQMMIKHIDDYDGTSIREGSFSEVKWSPDSSYVAFQEGSTVQVIDINGNDLFSFYNQADTYCWSPDSNTLLYKDVNSLRLVDLPNGDNDRHLIEGVADIISVNWSPDGSKIAYIVYDVTNYSPYKIVTIDADGTNPNATSMTEKISDCAWSPDGRKVAFLYEDSSGTSIAVINSDGSNLEVLTKTTELAPRSFCWSPNGTQIIFSGLFKTSFDTWDKKYDIGRINLDGTGLVRMTFTPDEEENNPMAGYFDLRRSYY